MFRKLIVLLLAVPLLVFLGWYLLTAPPPPSLSGRSWYLKSVETPQGDLVWKPKFTNQISLTFTPTEIQGSTGCNHYRGRYQRIRFTSYLISWGVFKTLVTCLDQQVLKQENDLINALDHIYRYELYDQELRLYITNSSDILLFEPAPD